MVARDLSTLWNLFAYCLGFALGSWLSALPLLVFSLLLLRRTHLEDRFLRENLEGYAEYAQSVRFRLLPGVW